jgi:hypothetical protein
MFVVFASFITSSLWISTMLQALKGYELYTFYLSGTHLLETGWTFIFGFGLLTPTLYTIGIIFKDPSLLFSEFLDTEGLSRNNVRTLLSLGISTYSIVPIFGNPAFGPLGLLLSMLNLIHVRNLQNTISTAVGLLGTILLALWLLL